MDEIRKDTKNSRINAETRAASRMHRLWSIPLPDESTSRKDGMTFSVAQMH